ncbi:MAG: hypothetical protein J6N49_05835 [Alphaproteobacteria bacterium]|nr:hypothetical protein [Alphaproteobacteria bacterium]
MDFIIILCEFAALGALAAFSGVLESKYYEKIKIKYLFSGIVVAVILWAILMYPDVPISGGVPHWIGLHILFNVLMLCLYGYSIVRFDNLQFQYEVQYLLARWCLGIGCVAEILAIGAVVWALC